MIKTLHYFFNKVFLPLESEDYRFSAVAVLLPFFLLLFTFQTLAQTPVFVRNYQVTGTAVHVVNGATVPNPGARVLVKVFSQLTDPNGGLPINVQVNTREFVADANGKFGPITMPCFRDSTGGYNSFHSKQARLVGGSMAFSGGSGGTSSCNLPAGTFLNSLVVTGSSNEPDLQNLGPSCPRVAKPVNVSNGNMWLSQSDYSLPGIGPSISINRFYNSTLQESGVFGFGWKSELDESIVNTDNEYLTLRTGNGRGFYFIGIGNNVFNPANIEHYKDVLKNADGTYTLNFLDGRTHKFHANGRLDWMKDRNGNQTSLAYSGTNGSGNLIGVTDGFGRTLNIVSNPNGTVEKIWDSLGTINQPIAEYEYDSTNPALLKSVTYHKLNTPPPNDRYESKYQFEYVIAGSKTFLQTVKDANGNILESHVYENDKVKESIGGKIGDVEIEKYEFNYVNANETHVTDGLGRVSKYFFDKSRGRNVLTRSDGLCGCGGGGGETSTYEYDERLNVVKEVQKISEITVDELVNTTWRIMEYTYDPLNPSHRLTATEKIQLDIDGQFFQITNLGTEKFTYNQFDQVLTYQDKIDSPNSGQFTLQNEFDADGNLKKVTDALGFTTEITYPTTNNKGLPETLKDQRGYVTKFKWFATGLLEWTEDPYLKKTTFEYDARGRTKKVTTPFEVIPGQFLKTEFNYYDVVAGTGDVHSMVEKIYPNGDKITYNYDTRRLLASVIDERGKMTSYQFDAAYRLTKITDPLLHTNEFDYDLMSNLKFKRDGRFTPTNLLQTDYRYDDFNRLKEIEYPRASSSSPVRLKEVFEYDQLGRVRKITDTAYRVTSILYDDFNRKRIVYNNQNESTVSTFNARGQLVEVSDAKSQTYNFSYDPFGKMKSQTRAGQTMTLDYDPAGNLLSRKDYLGRTTTYVHDKLNRLTNVSYLQPVEPGTIPAPAEQPIRTATYDYDEISRLKTATNEVGTVSFTYDTRSRVKTTRDVFGRKIEYEYDRTPTHNRKKIKFEDASYASYNFDDAERLKKIDSGDILPIEFYYDAADRLTSRSLSNAVSTIYGYDDMNRVTGMKDSNASTTLFDRVYSYNPASQISQITEPSQTRTFGYDNVDRLTSATYSAPGQQNENYSFDDVGNRTTSHLSSVYNYQAGQFNRLASTATANFVYDANGNLTSKAEGSKRWSFAWDHDNRLTMAWDGKDRVRYRYDALGRRVQRIVPSRGENTKFTYDGDDVLVDDNNGVLTKYINGPGVDNKLKMTTNGTVRYFVTDHLGSTNGLTDASGAIVEQTKYDSFGNATSNLSTRYQFTGREFDNLTGLHYYRARWYDASVGRFISEDPIGFAGGDVNLYGYVGNNPILNVDPRGLEVEATFSRSQGKLIVKDKWGGLGIWDWWYGPKSTNEYDVFSGNCQCDETTVGGPIPKGLYLIDKDHDIKGDVAWKRISYRLYASESGTMSGPFRPQKQLTDPNTGQLIIRDNFYLHPGSVSLGCVTLKKDSNLEDGAPWSADYEALDRTLKGTSPIFVKGDEFAGTLIVVD